VLKAESIWLGKALVQYMKPGDLLMNLGSSTRWFREHDQPHIQQNVFAPLEAQGVRILHIDLKQAEGVDLAGDLTEEAFLEHLQSLKPAAVLCSNLLEHLSERSRFCAAVERLIAPGSIAIVTCPYSFPYHPDPIDTLFRADANTLRQQFPALEFLSGEVVDCGSLWKFAGSHMYARFVGRILTKVILPLKQPSSWPLQLGSLKRISASCVVLRRR
jgi:hypothetical protein